MAHSPRFGKQRFSTKTSHIITPNSLIPEEAWEFEPEEDDIFMNLGELKRRMIFGGEIMPKRQPIVNEFKIYMQKNNFELEKEVLD